MSGYRDHYARDRDGLLILDKHDTPYVDRLHQLGHETPEEIIKQRITEFEDKGIKYTMIELTNDQGLKRVLCMEQNAFRRMSESTKNKWLNARR